MASYQIVFINAIHGESKRSHAATVEKTVRKGIASLGIDDLIEVRIFQEQDISNVNYRLPVVGVFFGGQKPSAESLGAVDILCEKGVFILPIADSPEQFSNQIPKSLRAINAAFIESDDHALTSISAKILEELRLLRSKRKVFISYKRTDSRAIAVQLYHSLDERSFDVFLDTHSIQRGALFQPMLWDHMGDADLVVLLDTPGAFDSQWVEKEISRAHASCLGILQLIWPGHSRELGTYLCDPIYLKELNFKGSSKNSDSLLVSKMLKEIVSKVEALRARAMAARRNRVISELCRIADEAGFKSADQLNGPVMMKHKTRESVIAFPVVGHPDSKIIHETFKDCKKKAAFKRAKQCLVYDPLGMWEGKVMHLNWLNDYLPVRTIPITEVSKWLKLRS